MFEGTCSLGFTSLLPTAVMSASFSPHAFCGKGEEKKITIRHMLVTPVTMEIMVHSEMGRQGGEGEWSSGAGAYIQKFGFPGLSRTARVFRHIRI